MKKESETKQINHIKKDLKQLKKELLLTHSLKVYDEDKNNKDNKRKIGELTKWNNIKQLQKKIERNLKTLDLIYRITKELR